jgi:cytidylate kinase
LVKNIRIDESHETKSAIRFEAWYVLRNQGIVYAIRNTQYHLYKMSAITISRQMGSQGSQLAQQVAAGLGWRWVSRDLINQAALSAGVPQVALAEIDELGLFGLHPSTKERRAYLRQIKTVIKDLAEQGNVVIVGRGGQVILQDRPDVFHARIVAPLENRVTWFQQEKNISAEAARACLIESDRVRARYLKQNFGIQVNDPNLYHVIINTGFLGLTQAVTLVVQSYQNWLSAKSNDSPA